MDKLKVAAARLQEFTGRFASVFPPISASTDGLKRWCGAPWPQAQPG